jgi:integrase
VSSGNLRKTDLEKWIKAGAPIAGKSDGGGLTFTLSRSQTATWIFRYRYGGRQREITLGNYPDMSLDDARKKATAHRAMVDAGKDVASEKRLERTAANSAMSFRELAEDYLERTGKSLVPRSQDEVRRFLKKDLCRRIGHVTARDVSPENIVSLVEDVGRRSDPVARRCFGLLSIIFAHGVAKSIVKVNPCNGLDLKAILGSRPPSRPRIKLTRDELSFALASFPTLGPSIALACKILLATCVRKSELLHARKSDLDFDRGVWQVYAKGSKTYLVPLAPTVADWFQELIVLAGDSNWILPAQHRRGRFENHHLGRSTLNAALKRLDKRVREFSPHDLRSTARSYLSALGVDLIVAERCLNHTLGGLVAVYDQHDYLDERRGALEKWANLLVELDNPSNVVPIRAAA